MAVSGSIEDALPWRQHHKKEQGALVPAEALCAPSKLVSWHKRQCASGGEVKTCTRVACAGGGEHKRKAMRATSGGGARLRRLQRQHARTHDQPNVGALRRLRPPHMPIA